MRQKRLCKLVAAMVSAAVMVSAVPGVFAAPVPAAAVRFDAQLPTREEILQAKNLGVSPASDSYTSWSWSYESGVTGIVNHYNGNVAIRSSIGGMGLTYNSQLMDGNDGMGTGMSFQFKQTITKMNEDAYCYADGSGSQYYFGRNPDGSITGEVGNYSCEILLTESGYDLYIGSHVCHFDEQGRVTWINAQTPVGMHYYDNGAVDQMYYNRTSYFFTYDDASATPQLQKVEAGGLGGVPVCTFDYNDSGYLTQINDSNGETISYTYNSDGLLTKISSSAEGKSLEFTYLKTGGLNRVANVKEVLEDGSITDSVQFAYGINQTIIMDKNGAVQVVSFNENGEVIY